MLGAATAETLRALHRAHLAALPFENLDAVVLGTAPSLALADVQEKLVRRPRGSYCYERNTLFAAGFVGGEWRDQYAFTLEPFEAADYAVMNWHIATHPRSPFRRSLYLQRTTADGGHREIAGRTLTVTAPDGTTVERRELVDDAELLALLRADFGIDPPEGTGLTRRG
ncbi:arylamine N-acetyltransferase family protein [Streptomyces mayteni]